MTATPATTSPPSPAIARDLSASLAVFLIALPLSLGIALATGAPSRRGSSPRRPAGSWPGGSAGCRSR